MASIVKMNAIDRLDTLLSDIIKNEPSVSTNEINQETSIQPIAKLTFSERNSYPSSVLPSGIVTTVPLPPRRNSSSLKNHHHRQHHHIDQTDKQKQHQPLLNSSTLDDLFRALTLECEQYLADSSSHQNKISNQMIIQPPTKVQVSGESNEDNYENLLKTIVIEPKKNKHSPLKTSIEVISPIKRHVVSITITSKISSPTLMCPVRTSCNAKTSSSSTIAPITSEAPITSPTSAVSSVPVISPPPPPPPPTTTTTTTTHCQSSDDDTVNVSSSNTTRKRRRRARKQVLSTTTVRSSSSSNERKEPVIEKKRVIPKRSCSTDPRFQGNSNTRENDFILPPSLSSQKQRTRQPHRRDVSLQHNFANSERYDKNRSTPLSVLLTSTKATSDFLDTGHQPQQRRSRVESVNQKSSALIDRLQQQFYRPTTLRNNNNAKNNNIPAHRIPPYPVY